MQTLVQQLEAKAAKPFWQKFRESKNAPVFNSDAIDWDDYKCKFIAFLGEYSLEALINQHDDFDSDSIEDYAEKNVWLFHCLNKNVTGAAITPLTELPTDDHGESIPDG